MGNWWKKLAAGLSVLMVTSMALVGCGGQTATQQQPANLLDKVKQSGQLTVGIMGTYPPYNFMNSQHQMDGFDADIAKEVAKRIGVKAKFVPTEWSGMIEGLLKGKFDTVISQMTITPDRQKQMDFSKPYIANKVSIIVKSDNNTIHTLQDFKGKRIGVGLGTNDETYLRNTVLPKVGNFQIVTYDDAVTSLKDLNVGRIDATINNLYALKPIIDQNHYQIKAVGDPLKVDYAGIAIRKNNPQLLQALDKALADMKADGTYKTIFKKWFGEDPTL